ncbi:MAG TPA: hypothetical protein VMA37_05525 [Acetobacteraceae bacterium]|nr:hypothetical protein [Acetobacteraceae bacterium]
MSAQETMRSSTLSATIAVFLMAGSALPSYAAQVSGASPFDSSGIKAIPEITVEAPSVLPPPGLGTDTGLIDGTGLKQYAMTDHQLGKVRGGFFLPSGVGLSFGFQQLTSVNGTVVQGILVPLTKITSNGGTIPIYVTGPAVNISSNASSTSQGATGGSLSSGGGIFSSNANVSLHQTNGTYTNYNGTSYQYQYSGGTMTFTPTGTQSSGTPITVSSTTNNGQTAVQTVLSGNGLFNSIANTANNQVITQATAININVTGLAESVAAQQEVSSLQNTIGRALRP